VAPSPHARNNVRSCQKEL